MEKVKVTIEQVLNFKANAERYINTRPGVFSKFIYALNKGLKNIKQVFEDYSEEIQEARYELADKDEKTKNILLDEKGEFVFSTESRKKLDKKAKEIIQKSVEIGQYLSKDVPDDVTVLLLEVFCPFVITDEDIENKFNNFELKQNHKTEA